MALRLLYSFPGRLGTPGIETIAWHQASGWVAQGFDVTVLAGSWTRPVDGARMMSTMTMLGVRVPYRIVGLERALSYHDGVARRMILRRAGAFDVLHAWPLGAVKSLNAARRTGILSLLERPNAHTRTAYEIVDREVSRLGLELPRRHSHSFNQRRLKREEAEYAAADRLLCPSEFVARTFVERGFARDRLARHQYGFDPALFPAPAPHASTGPGLSVAFVGRCEPRKGLHFALEAWLQSGAARRGKFHICGSFVPGYRELLAKQLSHQSVHVHGFVSDIGDLLRRCDVLVLPSLEEGSALVTYEARACGCVILVSDAAGAPCTHMVDGLIHRQGDTAALTEHLRTLDCSPTLLGRLREQSVHTLAGLTWAAAAVRLRQIVEESLANASKPSGRMTDLVLSSGATGDVIREGSAR